VLVSALLPALYTCAPADAVLERQFRAVRQTQGVTTAPTTEHSEATETVLSAADILKKLNIPSSPVVRQGGYGRKRRQAQNQASQTVKPTETTTEYVLPEGKYGDLSWLARLGIEPQPVDKDATSYSGRKKREDTRDILTNEIPDGIIVKEVEGSKKEGDLPVQSVKIKTRGNYGLRALQAAIAGDSEGVFRGRYSRDFGRRRRQVQQHFIPFSVYETDKVDTLKVEQNDFLALDQRLEREEQLKANLNLNPGSEERKVRKRQFSEGHNQS